MAYKGRRRLDRIVLAVGGIGVGVAGVIGSAIGDGERIAGYWASATVDEAGTAQVVEVIDYDFGTSDRRGIFREIPGLDPDALVEVASPTAPDPFVVESSGFGSDTRIRIGNPAITIDGRHRYRIGYPIGVGFADDTISWNAVGSDWQVGIHDIEVHLLVGNELSDLQCSQGRAGSWGGCAVSQVESGHLLVEVDEVDAMEGVTVSARRGAALGRVPDGPVEPTGRAADPGLGPAVGFAVGALGALAGAGAMSGWIRRSGRELVWAGGSADAAYGPTGVESDYQIRRVDHDELDALASTEFAPPADLAPWQGGLFYRESVGKDQKVAWLLEQAIAGRVEIEGSGSSLTLHRLDEPGDDGDELDHRMTKTLFGGRPTIDLSSYDKQFAAAWEGLDGPFNRWHRESPLWDPEGERRRRRVYRLGALVLPIGLVATVVFAAVAAALGPAWLIGAGVGAAVAGIGWSMLLRSWELRVRTPEGSGKWILIESFRRFIRGSDAQHVDAAAKRGQLLQYTAWAVALGEVDRWSDAVEAADLEGRGEAELGARALYLTGVAPRLGSATSTASTVPSDSGSGGGGGFSFGGGVGGGGGGGGGGSW